MMLDTSISSAMFATRAHVCVVAHITRDELATALQSVEMLNGFGNRFLWVLVHRDKLVPLPLPMPDGEFLPLQRRLVERVQHAQGVGEVEFSPAAREHWCTIYAELSADRPGLIGAVSPARRSILSRPAGNRISIRFVTCDTLTRWEAETRRSQTETAQTLASLQHSVQTLEARQAESEQNLRILSALAENLFADLRTLLQRLNSDLSERR